MRAFRVNEQWIEYAHRPAADDRRPLASELVELPGKDGVVFIPADRPDLVAEVISVAELYTFNSDVQDDDRLWWRAYPKNLIERGRAWLEARKRTYCPACGGESVSMEGGPCRPCRGTGRTTRGL